MDFNSYKIIRDYTESLCESLETEDYVVQPALFASPTKWHLAHTTWFFEELILKQYNTGYQEFNPKFNFLFNSYYNNVGDRTFRGDRGNMTRPTVEEVYEYRNHVNEGINTLFKSQPSSKVLELLELGLNHEQQHQELLLTDIKFVLGNNPIFPVFNKDVNLVNQYNRSDGFIRVDEGVYSVGHSGVGFYYDNELNSHQVYVSEFELSAKLVTNREYIEFVSSGGYQDFNLWLDEGWAWVQEEGVDSPLYWYNENGVWWNYTFHGYEKVDPNAILCHISYYEATAFAAWKRMRLPTEFEWEIAADKLDWGQRWEWTNSAYLPYPGFEIAEGAVGEYNGKFMANQMVLRGGSTATSKGHSRKTYRNFFHPHYQWQFSGIRLAK
ncbi:MAG: sulfatase maturase [Crocinitomicaceae bacterium]|nr:sulfatase maturase [Crocinitomicaceae bacterium]|tara:strand:+ start:11189 stop:12334 length:1146 start_codon:yes stop_codon:yes gene_type:complete